MESQRIGQHLPKLTVATLSPDSVTIGGIDAQAVTLVNLWATYCVPCVKEMPALSAVEQRYAGRGLRVVAVSVDQSDAKVKAFLLQHPLTLMIGRDPTGRITSALDNTALPQNVLIAADGRILYRSAGLLSGITPLDTAIAAALSQR